MAFGRSEGARISDTLACMRACFDQAGRDLASCVGEDASYLQKGFASHRVLRSQQRHIPELRSTVINSDYGHGNAVLGICAAVHFSLCSLASRGDDCYGLLLFCESWLQECVHKLRAWRPRINNTTSMHSLAAEMRCLERGIRGVQRASHELNAQEVSDNRDRFRFMLACMRKAMWPRAKRIDASSQCDLLRWVDNPEFVDDSCTHMEPRQRIPCTINVPLSAVPMLSPRECGDSDASSTWESSSSAASSFESSKTNEEDDALDCDSMTALGALLKCGSV